MAKKIADIDKNFSVADVNECEFEYYSVCNEPFKIYGGQYNGKCFVRMPQDDADKVSDGVSWLCKNTAGIRVKFKTNSTRVSIKVKMKEINFMPHMTVVGISGFDMYEQKDNSYEYVGVFMPKGGDNSIQYVKDNGGYSDEVSFQDDGMHNVTINFPLYNDVEKVEVGLVKGSDLQESNEYTVKKPIVYYGSSITQGGCASRPGNSYAAMLSRKYDADYYNLGFSGNAKGEDSVAEYISKIPMSLFVYDYDYNSPSVEHLEKTHEKMYKIIREHNNAPIIILSKPKNNLSDSDKKRRDIIFRTYENGKSNGDKVYFIDGQSIFEGNCDCTVDGVHPNDLGFMYISKKIESVIEKNGLLKK